MPLQMSPTRIGFVPARRGFFNRELAVEMRTQTLAAMEAAGIAVVVPDTQQSELGCVETVQEARIAAALFRRHDVHGIVVGALNFGDEQTAALAIRRSGLDVPVLLFGCQEQQVLTLQTDRRDAFCGLLSIGEALRQIGVTYTVARRPICFPSDATFQADLDWFVRVCRVVHGVRNARYGQIGARPDAFWTCRFDEKAMQRLGPTVVTLDLSEVLGGVQRIADDEPEVQAIVQDIHGYADTSGVPAGPVLQMAKFELFVRRWAEANALDALGVQCWTSIQNNLGICACTTMSRLGETGVPCACEADMLGTLSMHASLLASGTPATLVDWNNLHNEDDELVNLFHCGVYPASFAGSPPKMANHFILPVSGATAREHSFGTIEFVMKEGPLTLSRVSQGAAGGWQAVVAEGAIEANRAQTAGGYGWCRVPNLQRLYRDVLLRHFPHHAAVTQGHLGNVLWEAFGNYLGFAVHHAAQTTPGQYTPTLPFA